MTTPATASTTTLAGSSNTSSNTFDFPREYHFPPFFTRQTNVNTHRAQLEKWSSLILAYCAHHKLYKLSLSASAATTNNNDNNNNNNNAEANAEDLFHNRKLNRRLSIADAREVLEFMRKEGRAEFVGGGDSSSNAKEGGGDVAWIYWKTPEEWAKELESWVDETAQKGTVLTVYELTQGEATRGSAFHGLDRDVLQKALQVLVKRGKAQIFGQEDSQGVKFF
ncbi:ESCRT-II complex- vps25 subunit [Apiospora arundinis]